jgi:hypothetical protein
MVTRKWQDWAYGGLPGGKRQKWGIAGSWAVSVIEASTRPPAADALSLPAAEKGIVRSAASMTAAP